MFKNIANNKMNLKTGKIKKNVRSVKNKKKYSNSKILRMMFQCLYFKELMDVISWKDEKKGQFKIKFMNKNNPNWHASMLLLFKMSESAVSEKRSLNYKIIEKEKHDESTKCRFRSNLNRLVYRKILEFLGTEDGIGSKYRIYQFVDYGDELRNHLLKKETNENGRKKIKKGDKNRVSMQVSIIVPVISKEISHYLCLSSQISKLESGDQNFKFVDVSYNACTSSLSIRSPQSSGPGSASFIASSQSRELGNTGSTASPWSSGPGSASLIASSQSRELGNTGSTASPWSSGTGSASLIASSQCRELGSAYSAVSPQSNEFENGWPFSSNCCDFSNRLSPESYSSTAASFESLSMDEEHGNTENDDSNAILGDSNCMLPSFDDFNDINSSNLHLEDLEEMDLELMDSSLFNSTSEGLTKLENMAICEHQHMDPSLVPFLDSNEDNILEVFDYLGFPEEKI